MSKPTPPYVDAGFRLVAAMMETDSRLKEALRAASILHGGVDISWRMINPDCS
jgi:hypothetical protein